MCLVLRSEYKYPKTLKVMACAADAGEDEAGRSSGAIAAGEQPIRGGPPAGGSRFGAAAGLRG
jgi:hypothetical protein